MRCTMVGSSFTILSETPCADPLAGQGQYISVNDIGLQGVVGVVGAGG